MLPLEHSAVLLTSIKLPFFIKVCVLSIPVWPFYTCFTVLKLDRKYAKIPYSKTCTFSPYMLALCLYLFVLLDKQELIFRLRLIAFIILLQSSFKQF